jgi:CheY-like chemotaxis protein
VHIFKVVAVEERGPRLLVIEDARDQAILVGVAAKNAHPGLEVHITEDGQQGIDFLAGIAPLRDPPVNPTPDLVILDLMMPVVDGFGVLEWLREAFDRIPFPVVVLTGSPEPENMSRARDLGATDVFEKPKSLDGLGDAVREIVTRYIPPGDIIAAHMRQSG